MSKKKETKVVKGVVCDFTKNKHDVTIKMCCASCKHHEPYDSDGPRRACKQHIKIVDGKETYKIVDKSDCCGDWQISEQIDDIKLRP